MKKHKTVRKQWIDVTIPNQRLIDRFVNAVFLYNDHLVITFNCKEGCKTISLDDMMDLTKSHGSDIVTCGAPFFKSDMIFSYRS